MTRGGYNLGQIPMRHLVYRVQALSQSLLPLVWDFGTLKSARHDVEKEYIQQMVIKFVSQATVPPVLESS